MADLQYVLEVEPLDLGADVKAVGLDLVEIESREPAHGADAARLWAATLGALPGTEPWALDFFSHLDRVREYCRLHGVPFEEKALGPFAGHPRAVRRSAGRELSSDLRVKRLALARERCWPRAIPPWKTNWPSAAWTLITPHSGIIYSAQSAISRMVFLRCSPKNCGPAKCCAESSPPRQPCRWKSPARNESKIKLVLVAQASACGVWSIQ